MFELDYLEVVVVVGVVADHVLVVDELELWQARHPLQQRRARGEGNKRHTSEGGS